MSENRREEFVGVWRRSMWTWGFWWRTITTLSLYVWLLWRKNQIEVTTRRINQRRGNIIGGEETAISIENVTDITVTIPPLGEIFGYGDITVQSAGSSTAEINFDGLAGVKNLRDVLFDLKDGYADDAARDTMDQQVDE